MLSEALLVLMVLWCTILIILACVGVPRRRKPSVLEKTLAQMGNEKRGTSL